jgi:hypothetical protein
VQGPARGVVHVGVDFVADLGDTVPFEAAAVVGDVAEPANL